MSEPSLFDEWWAVVFSVLEARALDDVEPEEEEVERAVLSLAAVTMTGVGMDPDEVTTLLSEGGYDIFLSYDPESDQVAVTLDWDGEEDFTFTSDISGLT